MYEGREVFAHAPLVLVTAEIRLGYEPTLRDPATLEAIGATVRSVLPLLELDSTPAFSVETPDGAVTASDTTWTLRALNRARTVSAAVSAQSLTVDATEYEDFEDFAAVVRVCLEALNQRAPDASVVRMGLRYIDEVRAPAKVGSSDQWSRWIDSRLLAPISLVRNEAAEAIQGTLLYHLAAESRVLFRWGEAFGHSVLAPNMSLRRPGQATAEGKFFVLDVDSFWEPALAQALDVPALLSRLSELHDPAGGIFSAAITEEGRQMFRGASVD